MDLLPFTKKKNVSSLFFLMTSKHDKLDLSQTGSQTSVNK